MDVAVRSSFTRRGAEIYSRLDVRHRKKCRLTNLGNPPRWVWCGPTLARQRGNYKRRTGRRLTRRGIKIQFLRLVRVGEQAMPVAAGARTERSRSARFRWRELDEYGTPMFEWATAGLSAAA